MKFIKCKEGVSESRMSPLWSQILKKDAYKNKQDMKVKLERNKYLLQDIKIIQFFTEYACTKISFYATF